jgi:nucleoside-diphosphate-sugar epimerase
VYGSADSPENGFSETLFAPDTLYGWSKHSAEQVLGLAAARISGFCAVSLRLAGVHGLGRNSGALYAFARAALDNAPLKIAEPDSRFRWTFVEDVLQGVDCALTSGLVAEHHIVNLASADSFTLLELAEQIRQAADSQCAIESSPDTRVRRSILNIDKAQHLLGFKPTSLKNFLSVYLSDLRNQ